MTGERGQHLRGILSQLHLSLTRWITYQAQQLGPGKVVTAISFRQAGTPSVECVMNTSPQFHVQQILPCTAMPGYMRNAPWRHLRYARLVDELVCTLTVTVSIRCEL